MKKSKKKVISNNPESECLNPPHIFVCKKCGLYTKEKYIVKLHPIQEKIFNLIAGKEMVDKMTLRKIGEAIGTVSPQKVKHHISQLVRYGYINIINGKYKINEK